MAGLTFYLRFREVAQGDDEKKAQQENDDLESTFQLHQLTETARDAMLLEASQVTWEVLCDAFTITSELPGFSVKYQARFLILNGTGKRLTDIHVHIPDTETHYGEFAASRIDVPDFDGKSIRTLYAEPFFASKLGLHATATLEGIRSRGEGPKGPVEVFANRAVLTFRVAGGPRWQLPLNASGESCPTLKL